MFRPRDAARLSDLAWPEGIMTRSTLRLALGCVLLVVTASCLPNRIPHPAPPDSPLFRRFNDAGNWMLGSSMVYRVGESNDSIVVPMGFVTDFASIPRFAWTLVGSPTGSGYALPAVVHDFLYWTHT